MVWEALRLLYSWEPSPEEEARMDAIWEAHERAPETERAHWRALQLKQQHRLKEDAAAMVWCLLTWETRLAEAEAWDRLNAAVEAWVREAEHRRAEQLQQGPDTFTFPPGLTSPHWQ